LTDGSVVDVLRSLAVLVVAAWYRRCSDAASTCPSEDDYYIGFSSITYCVFSLV